MTSTLCLIESVDKQDSLKESLRLLLDSGPVGDDLREPLVDSSSGLVERFRVVGLRSVELSAVTAAIAVADHALLVEFGAWLPLGGPLPRILSTVGEEDVSACGVETTLIDCGLPSLRIHAHVKAIKHIGAVLLKVLLVDNWAAHRMNLIHSLEPAVLSTVLEAPRTA